jgi:AmmeMemoRadiSam system protein B
MIRRPAVAGQFYPADPQSLRDDLASLTRGTTAPSDPRGIALMVPHAGYMYSGRVAAETYTSVGLARRIVILCPNHTGQGEALAINVEGGWDTPLGRVPVDAPLARAILEGCGAVRIDGEAHRREHSLEVQLPFLQHLVGEFTFVPLCVGTRRLEVLLDLGRAIAAAIGAAGAKALVVISSDMSHYVPAPVAHQKDRKAIERVLALDPEGLHRVVLGEEISMCGLAPAVAGLEAARRIGFREARLVAYSHSGETTGDLRSVVGYAGVAVT